MIKRGKKSKTQMEKGWKEETTDRDREKQRQRETQRHRERGYRGTFVSLCVNVLIERDDSVERETMKMQSHSTPFIQILYSVVFTLPNFLFCCFKSFTHHSLKCVFLDFNGSMFSVV